MSTDVQPPSPTATLSARIPSSPHKQKNNQSPPAAMERKPSRRKHGRSTSFNEFVSRILPSHRGERGHTLREQYKDDGSQSPVSLVFGLPLRRNSGDRSSVESDDGKARKTKSWSPRKSIGDETDGPQVGLKRSGALRRIFGSSRKEKEVEKGEGAHIHQALAHSTPLHKSEISAIEVEKQAISAQTEITKSQQMYADKKSLREQRRSLRDSDDFLGIQGANPRTGYWDISDSTSTSEPSQMSDETKRKLDEKARELEEQKRRFEEAEVMHKSELERVQALRDKKKKEKAEQKKGELKMKQRQHGKWNIGETGWSSVAEPNLSPIQQSLAGTPVVETPAADRLFPMPTATDPTPYIDTRPSETCDYFGHRVTSSPLANERFVNLEEITPMLCRNVAIQRKPVGSPSRRKNDESFNTVVRSSINDIQTQQPVAIPYPRTSQIEVPTPELLQEAHWITPPASTSHRGAPFLEIPSPSQSDTHNESEASVTSYQLVSTKQAVGHQPLGQSPMISNPGERLISLDSLPAVHLKDPIATLAPSSSPTMRGLPIWVPLTVTKTEPELHLFSTSTSITTTTGYGLLQSLPAQFDGPNDMSDAQVRPASLQRKPSRIPLRTSSQQKGRQSESRRTASQAHLVDTVISSEPQLNQTKQRTVRLCRMLSPEGDKVEMKNTPTFISTFPRSPKRQVPEAREAARLAFQNFRHQVAMKKTVGQNGGPLTPQKLRSSNSGGPTEINREFKLVQVGQGDIWAPFESRSSMRNPELFQRRLVSAAQAGGIKTADDSIVVWHPSPEKRAKRNVGKPVAKDMKAVIVHQKKVSPVKGPPKRGRVKPSAAQMIFTIIQSIWWFLEPIFNSESVARRRIEQQHFMWAADIGLFVAAIMFGVVMFLLIILSTKVIGVGIQVLKGLMILFKLLIGL